jgi:dTMP kinase
MLNHYLHCRLTEVNKNKKGFFIVIEGLDGSGKTTQAKTLARKLRKSHNAVFTAEPSRGKIGTFIRNRILYGQTRPPVSVEALLFAADRIDHIQSEVQPAIDEGKLVVSDRYVYSSLAYQGSAGLNLEWIETINQLAQKPDLAIFIDVAPEVVLERLKRKKSIMENLETQRKVRDIYHKFIQKGELIRIDGEKTKSEVAKEVLSVVTEFLKTRS